MASITKEVLIGLLQNPQPATKKNINATCPYCGKDGHFFIHEVSLLNDCKKCGKQGNGFSFLQAIGRLDLLEGRQIQHDKLKLIDTRNITQSLEIDVPNIRMPIGTKELNYFAKGDAFVDYLKRRKLKEIDFQLYKPSNTMLKAKYFNYALLQVQRDFQLKGFIGRYIGKDSAKLRYLNSESDFSKLLFGYDELMSSTRDVIITEGVYDKTSVTTELGLHDDSEMKCVCTFGKKISDVHCHLLKRTNVSNIILLFDGRDAVNDNKQASFKLKKEGFNVYVGYTKDKDAGDCNGSELFAIMNKIETAEQFFLGKLHKRKIKQ